MMVFDDTVTNPNNIVAPITDMKKDSQNANKNPDFQVNTILSLQVLLPIGTQFKSNLFFKVCNME